MQSQENNTGWQVWGASVRGASHQQSGKENQDALRWMTQNEDCPDAYILAVADGHGSSRSPKSAIGSRLAVEVLVELAKDYVQLAHPKDYAKEEVTLANPFSFVKQNVEQRLPQDLIRVWRERVDQDLVANSLKAQPAYGQNGAAQNSTENHYLAYGTTILGVVLTSHYLVYIQLGDGDILTVSESGEVTRPFLRDHRLLANQTTSLATTSLSLNTLSGSSSYASDVYVKFEFLQNNPPALILVSTDGYSNSYKDDQEFEQIGPDYLELLKTEGLAGIQENLASWLSETSQTGSGDDITLGLIVRADILPHRDLISPVPEIETEPAFTHSEHTEEEGLRQATPEEVVE